MVACALGAFALLADATPGPVGRVLLLVASTGLAWGIAAAMVGARSPSAGMAALNGGLVMVGAVVIYYGGAGLLGLRPAADWTSLRNAGTVWALLGLVTGPALGLLCWHATRAEGIKRSILWGLLGGALLSQALSLLPRDVDGFRELFTAGLGTLALLLLFGVTVPVVIVVIGARRQNMGAALIVTVTVGIAGAIAWEVVQRAL